jgi:predicted esterase
VNILSGFRTLTSPRGKELEYVLSLPEQFDVENEYRVILAIPPGEQTRSLVGAYQNWLEHFAKREWVMICPVTPDGKLFFQGSERYLPHLMDNLQNELKLVGEKFYLLGVSNGGVSAFRAATLYPDRFHSMTVMPGWPKPADENRLDKILGLPVNFVVGENDHQWRRKSEEFANTLKEMGSDVSLEIIPLEGHMAFQHYPPHKLEHLLMRNC